MWCNMRTHGVQHNVFAVQAKFEENVLTGSHLDE
jgi:hypothetical protein